jgi:hypothetical protein
VREAAEREFPALRPALMELSGRINSDTMRRLITSSTESIGPLARLRGSFCDQRGSIDL